MKKAIFLSILGLGLSSILNAQKIMAHYPFCGSANDFSGNGFNGVVNGPVLGADRFGRASSAYYFDGVDDIIQISHDSLLDFDTNDEFSVSVWVRTDSLQQHLMGNERNFILTKWYDSGPNTFGFPYDIRINNQATSRLGKVTCFRRGEITCVTQTEAQSNARINDLEWHHIAMIKKGRYLSLYIDNQLDTVVYESVQCSPSNTFDVHIGMKSGPANPSPFKGYIDDIYIFSGAIDQNTLTSLYQDTTMCQTMIPTFEESISEVDVFPNPFQQQVHIESKEHRDITRVEFYDIQGNIVHTEENPDKGSDLSLALNAEPGVYYLKVYSEEKLIGNGRLVKQ